MTSSPRRYSRAALVAVVLGLSSLSACGDSPSGPGPITPPPPPPPVNTAPVIESISASVTRTEVDTDVTVTATVRDAETPVTQLTYTWAADAGTFSGTGATVTWRVARGATTPVDIPIRLTVTESYGTGQQNTVTGTSSVVRVHDSPKELGDMGLAFLRKFGDSSISAESCLVDFSQSCRGRADELVDITKNRKQFVILNYTLGTPRVSYQPGSNTARTLIRGSFASRIISCIDWPVGVPCSVGGTETSNWDGELTSVYENGRWWICTSHALPLGQITPTMRVFFGALDR